jgi:sec-independent protein translocase protein TatA
MDLFAPSHLLILLLIILVVFGPSKLGDVGGALGRAIKDFKRAMNDETPANPPSTTVASEQPTSEKPINPA